MFAYSFIVVSTDYAILLYDFYMNLYYIWPLYVTQLQVFKGVMNNNSECAHGHFFQEKCSFISIPLAIKTGQNEVYKVVNTLIQVFLSLKWSDNSLILLNFLFKCWFF